MNRNYLLLGLCAVVAIVSSIVFSYPDMADRYAEMRRDAMLSVDVQNALMAVIALAIGGFLGWHFMKRD